MLKLKSVVIPWHPFKYGVTVMMLLINVPVLLDGVVHGGIEPLPLAAIPIAVFELIHENVPPFGTLEKLPISIGELEQEAMSFIGDISGVGYIITEKLKGFPEQKVEEGVTVIIPSILEPVLLAGAVHALMLPLPPEPKPIAALELDHVKVAPGGLLVKFAMFITSPGHTEILDIGVTD